MMNLERIQPEDIGKRSKKSGHDVPGKEATWELFAFVGPSARCQGTIMVLDNAELYLLFLPLFENYPETKKYNRCSNLCSILNRHG
jgi:hypothetical protein